MRIFDLPGFISLVLILSFFGASPLSATELTLVYSGNLNGELEPCGCSEEGDLGGILRRASKIQALRKSYPDLILVSSGGLVSFESAQDRLKGKYIFAGLETLSYDAIGIQWRDLAFGLSLLTDSKLPWLASNWSEEVFMTQRRVQRGHTTVQIFSWLDPEQDPNLAMKTGKSQVTADMALLTTQLQQAKNAGQVTVVLSSLPAEKAQAQLPLKFIDVLLIESNHELYGEPRKVGRTLILQPGSRGMRLGKVQLQLDAPGRVHSYQHEVISLPKSISNAPDLAVWYENYNKDVKAAYLKKVKLRKAQRAGKSPYAGEESCESCHGAAYKVWSGSEHAKAYDDLEQVNKSFDPECLLCHTVGFDKEGGFIDMKLTLHLAAVQCENCHGAARAHVEAAGSKATANKDWAPLQMCQQCHVGSHSPAFDLDKYWPKIVHGK